MSQPPSDRFLPGCLLLDLETSQSGQILKIGAARDCHSFLRTGRFDIQQALRDLDVFAADAICLVGHNVLQHDLAVLTKHQPELVLLRLPVVDTLYLSPICFPENPYHRLVKDYKLVADSLNDPVADSRLAGTLMLEEIASLKGLAQTAPDFFRCLYLLLGNETDADPRLAAGMRMVFEAAADCVPQTNADECLQRLSTVVGTQACSTCVRGLTNGGEGDRETASGCSGDQ